MKCIRTSEYVLRAGRIMRSALFIAHSVGLPSLVASSIMRSTNGIWFYLVGCFIVYFPTQVACLFTILVACVRLTNFQFKQIFGDMVLNHDVVGFTARGSVRTVVHPLNM